MSKLFPSAVLLAGLLCGAAIAPAIRGLHAGDRVTLQVSYGSGGFQAEVALAAPPSAYP